MTHAISLIYGEHVLDDLEFCCQHDEIIKVYSCGIMTLQSSPGETIEAVARDPARFPGWAHLLKNHPQDCALHHGFLLRLIRHYVKTGRLMRTFFPL
jgi:hypothetical protein